MRVISLQSGSNGNCVYVESRGTRLLVDAGISGLCAERRLAERGGDIRSVDGLLISHDHRDHTRCLGIYHRKYDIPVHITPKTLAGARRNTDLGPIRDTRHFAPGETIQVGKLKIETVATPHDAVEGVVFVVDDGARRLGILTDLGHVFPGLVELVQSLDAVIIESNYDPGMLEDGPYSEQLKRRIRGPHGHLSNEECAEVVLPAARRLRWACLAHLSEENNDPHVALRTFRRIVGGQPPVSVASRYEATAVMEL